MAILQQEVRRGLLLLTLVSLAVWIVLVRMADPAQEQRPVPRQSGSRSQGWWLAPEDYAELAAGPRRLAALLGPGGRLAPVKGPAPSLSFSFHPRQHQDPEGGRAGAESGPGEPGAVAGHRPWWNLSVSKLEGEDPPAREAQEK